MIRLFDRLFGGINKYFTGAIVLSLLLLWGDMRMSGKFGASISEEVYYIAMGISLASGILLVLAALFYFRGWKPLGVMIAGVWAVAFAFNVYSNMGVAKSDRDANMLEAATQTQRVEDVRAALRTAEENVQRYTAEAEKRTAEFDRLTSVGVGAWKAAVSLGPPATFDPLIAEKEAERNREQGRGGCGPKCEARSAELRHLIGLKAAATAVAVAQDLKDQALKAADRERTKALALKKGHSTVAAQSSLHSLIFTGRLSGKVDEVGIQMATNATGIFLAFVLAVVAAGVTLAGAWPLIMAMPAMALNPYALEAVPPKPDALLDRAAMAFMPAGGGVGQSMGNQGQPADNSGHRSSETSMTYIDGRDPDAARAIQAIGDTFGAACARLADSAAHYRRRAA